MADRTFHPRGQSDADRQRATQIADITNRLLQGETAAARAQLQQMAQTAVAGPQGPGATTRPDAEVTAEADSLIDRFHAGNQDSDQVQGMITGFLENVNAPQHPAVQARRDETIPPPNFPSTSQGFNPEAAEFVPGQQASQGGAGAPVMPQGPHTGQQNARLPRRKGSYSRLTVIQGNLGGPHQPGREGEQQGGQGGEETRE